MPSKYLNKKVEYNGMVFDSQKELKYYLYYLGLEKSGEITRLNRQVAINLDVNKQRICKYKADFTYIDKKGKYHVIDIKSEYTRKMPVFRLKAKLFKAIYGQEIEVVE